MLYKKSRDKTYGVDTRAGRETNTIDEMCACRSCYIVPEKGGTDNCLTYDTKGCPMPLKDPEHLMSKSGARCVRCGHRFSYSPRAIKYHKQKQKEDVNNVDSNQTDL